MMLLALRKHAKRCRQIAVTASQLADEIENIALQIDAPIEPTGLKIAGLTQLAIKQALEECDGHREKAAKQLGISLRTLYRRLKDQPI